eukprot:TRINITY_DN5954_c0_g1_i1.p1 TRINITY_DN5954_c0_g1~~TRINITY_DN5954_c0_g1_i1.p1  ORF type:complete len:575 (+),score=109.88 TRINITY_DN5954_c0_g1_i1:1-1725(+)
MDSVSHASVVNSNDKDENFKDEDEEELSEDAIQYYKLMGITIPPSKPPLSTRANNDSFLNGKNSEKDNLYQITGIAMTMKYIVLVSNCDHPQDKMVVKAIVDRVFKKINKYVNSFNGDSYLSKNINQNSDTSKITNLPPMVDYLLNISNEIYNESQGRYDISFYPLFQLWKSCLINENRIPNSKEIEIASKLVGWKENFDYEYSPEGSTLTKKNKDSKIDFGSIAKGLAIDLILYGIKKAGFNNIYVDWGSDIKCVGKHPKRSWVTSILKPPSLSYLFKIWKLKWKLNLSAYLLVFPFDYGCPLSLCTSGDYVQNHQFGYYHIMDVKISKLMQSTDTSISSVSIVCDSCTVSDALSTTAMTFECAADAKEWLESVRCKYSISSYHIYSRKGGILSSVNDDPKILNENNDIKFENFFNKKSPVVTVDLTNNNKHSVDIQVINTKHKTVSVSGKSTQSNEWEQLGIQLFNPKVCSLRPLMFTFFVSDIDQFSSRSVSQLGITLPKFDNFPHTAFFTFQIVMTFKIVVGKKQIYECLSLVTSQFLEKTVLRRDLSTLRNELSSLQNVLGSSKSMNNT